jgi:hypothetical protein
LARNRFLEEVTTLEKRHEISLFKNTPSAVPKNLLPEVAKLHFSNVEAIFKA